LAKDKKAFILQSNSITMGREILEIIFLCGMVLQIILRSYYIQYYKAGRKVNYFNKKERLFLLFIFVGFQLLPLIYVFSTWFGGLDYNLPKWVGIPATLLYIFGIWLFFKAHADLGRFWSPGLELREDHELIKTGVFSFVRHPMYAAFVIIAVAQIFMLQNWLVGPAFLVSGIPFYLHRVRREERQLISRFGDDYRQYIRTTGRIFPKRSLMMEVLEKKFPRIVKMSQILKVKNPLTRLNRNIEGDFEIH
jgi:protein-S-isoprenylcysteine O-methyltransferase Ste14